MNRTYLDPRPRDVLLWLLLSTVAALLLAESWYCFRISYALLRIHMVFFPSSPPSPGILTQAVWGLLLIAAAGFCILRRKKFLQKSLAPAIGLLLYGLWCAYTYGRSMIAVSGALEGDDIALRFLSGMGFIAIGVLALAGHFIHTYRGASDRRDGGT